MRGLAKFLCGVTVLALPVLAACGDDDNDKGASAATQTPSGGGVALSDEAYLKVLCTGLVKYQDTILSTTTKADDIAKVIRDYIASFDGVTPPKGLEKWQQDYTKYLNDAINDPTALVVTPPPMPPDSERDRLASKTSSVPECKYPTFLGEKR
jgi:hypothetical protein